MGGKAKRMELDGVLTPHGIFTAARRILTGPHGSEAMVKGNHGGEASFSTVAMEHNRERWREGERERERENEKD